MQNEPLITRADAAKLARQLNDLQKRGFTWHNLSTFVAKIMLGVFFTVWLGVFWWMIEPQFFAEGFRIIPQQLLYGGISAGLAIGLALACTIVPSVFWSSLIAQTPAAELLNQLYARYGRSGYYVAFIGAILFTFLGHQALNVFWLSKPNAVAQGPVWLEMWTLISLFLAVVFPAWALNRMTPDQWIDNMIQAREVANLQRAMMIEDMIDAAILARVDLLLYSEVVGKTLDAYRPRSLEIAAILADSERRFNTALGRIGATFRTLHGMSLAVSTAPDDTIVKGYKRLADLLAQEQQIHFERETGYADYVERNMPLLNTPQEPAQVFDGPTVTNPASFMSNYDAPQGGMGGGMQGGMGFGSDAPAAAGGWGSSASASQMADGMPFGSQHAMAAPGSPGQPWHATGSGSQDATEPEQAIMTPLRDVVYPEEFAVCFRELRAPFTVSDIMRVTKKSQRSADRMRVAWLNNELIAPTQIAGSYWWTTNAQLVDLT